MTGRIVKGISGFYYVYVEESGIYECKAKGAFRNQKIKPLVGDYVEIAVIDENNKLGNVVEILPRKNELIRPAVANVDQALVIFSVTEPTPNLNLLDRFLVMMEYQNIPAVVVFSKMDLADDTTKNLFLIYQKAGYRVLPLSVQRPEDLSELRNILSKKTTTVAGPSGVGKSTMTNALKGREVMETGAISKKISRGKNTTRHTQCIYLQKDTYLMDTPGFGSMLLPEIEKEDLGYLFPEFRKPSETCRFQGCAHIHEPQCGVKAALEKGEIEKSRYDNYRLLYDEIKNRKRY